MVKRNLPTEETGPQRRLFLSLQTKFIINFILMFLLIMIGSELIEKYGIPFTTYKGELGHERKVAFRALNLIADLKKERLLNWLKERSDDVKVLSENDLLISAVVETIASIDKLAGRKRTDIKAWAPVRKKKNYIAIANLLKRVKASYGVYDKIKIAEAKTGIIIASTDGKSLGADVSSLPFFADAFRSVGVLVTDVALTVSPDIHPDLHLSHAIRDKEGKVIAVLITDINTDDMIKPMLHTGSGLGKRGEALLVNKDVKILTSLKHPLKNGLTPKPLTYRIKAKPAILAARGEEGIIEADDYRGEAVLAAYRYLPVTSWWGWGMVVKRDKDELFAPLWHNMTISLSINLIAIFGFVMLTILLTKSLIGPILYLSKTAARVADGDLDARVPVPTHISDEVGVLTETFNSMVQSIKDRTEELRNAQDEMVRKEKLAILGQLSGGVGHELRNPLGVISNAVYYLKTITPNAEDKVKEYMNIISMEVDSAEKIVSDLMDFSRAKQSEREEIPVSELISQVLTRKPPPEEIKVTTKIAPNLSSLHTDSRQIGQVLTNLITNACQAMPEGGSLTIKAEDSNDKVRISISDTGCGISCKNRAKIFEPLFTTKAQGIGFGLSVTKNFLHLNGGSIEVKSQEGKGSTFTILLPAYKT